MKIIRLLTLIAVLTLLFLLPENVIAISNSGFETGDFTGWTTIGETFIKDSTFGSVPTEGIYEAVLTTLGENTDSFNISGADAVSASDLETFLGLASGSLSAMGASEGSAIKQTFTANAGDTLIFNFNFLTDEPLNLTSAKDFAFVVIDGQITALADTLSAFQGSLTELINETGFGTFTYTFTSSGNHSIAFGVADVEDNVGASALLIDNISVTSGPVTDTDGDGVPDDQDGCPNDPSKITPGICGCSIADTDSDGDGTADCNDGCPGDPLKMLPGVCGCGVADTDSDGDGTADCNDRCPGDPYKIQPGVCGCGVADTDSDGDGYYACTGDCNDSNAAINPGAYEICDGVDNNCNGQIDEGLLITFYRDADGDAFGNPTDTIQACSQPAGYVTNNSDCNDQNAVINPLAADNTCNGTDENCNGTADEGYVPTNTTCGVGVCASTGQMICQNGQLVDTCTSGQPQIEICNGLDDNCDGSIDEGVTTIFYQDADGDNYGNAAVTVQACAMPQGYVINNTDCNDNNAAIHPEASEVCNGIDDNCNGNIDEGIYVFGGFQQPINSDGSSIFKLGRTIPVKVVINDCSGQSISTATVTIAVYKISDAILGTEEEMLADASGNANTDNLFRYDATAGKYIFNLSTKGYTTGTYKVYANLDSGDSYSVNFSLK